MKQFKRITALLLIIVMLLALCACNAAPVAAPPAAPAAPQKTEEPSVVPAAPVEDDTSVISFLDSAGRTVEIDRSTDKIAALMAMSYHYMIMLKQTSRIKACMSMNPWAYEITDHVTQNAADIQQITDAAQALNVEQLLEDGIELVFYWPTRDDVLKECDDVGLPCVGISSSSSEVAATTADEYIKTVTDDVFLYAKALGNGAEAIADQYFEYASEKIHMVEDRVSGLAKEDYKTVYWMRTSDDGLQAFCGGSVAESVCNITGGTLVTTLESGTGNVQNISTYTTVTMEQLYEWDPDVILMGRTGNINIVLQNEQWDKLKAVKAGEVHICPTGVFNWDGGIEAPLMVIYVAQILHPELFEDVNMKDEVKYFYSNFLGYDLTDDQAGYVLSRLGPDGK